MPDQYYTPNELAKLLKLAPSKVRQVFANRPGVIVIEQPRIGRRPYRTLRIPSTAVDSLKRGA